MPSTTVTVGSSVGLHARPAGIIANTAADMDADITLAVPDGDPVDAGSALMLMTLGAEFGDEVVITSDDEEAMKAIASLVEQDLDADDSDDSDDEE